jgi:peptide methionine sulfoxide reductase MsrB
MSGRRTYAVRWIPVIVCSECNENIVERSDESHLRTRADVKRYRIEHENQHLFDEGKEPLPVPGS